MCPKRCGAGRLHTEQTTRSKSPLVAAADAGQPVHSRAFSLGLMQLCRRAPSVIFGGSLLLLVTVTALLGPIVYSVDPLRQDLRARNKPPLWQHAMGQVHYLGTDQLGRDLLARSIHGLRLSLIVGFGATAIAALVGISLGLVAGYFGAGLDAVVMRIVDIQMSFPYLLLAIVWAALFGGSFWQMVIIIAFRGWVDFARVIRGLVLSAKEETFIEAAIAVGATTPRILLRHVMPQVTAPSMIIFSLQVGAAIILESTLGFLGLGINPPTPTLGGILSMGRAYMVTAWWIITVPGLLIMMIVLAVNSLGDGLRDILDPKLRV